MEKSFDHDEPLLTLEEFCKITKQKPSAAYWLSYRHSKGVYKLNGKLRFRLSEILQPKSEQNQPDSFPTRES